VLFRPTEDVHSNTKTVLMIRMKLELQLWVVFSFFGSKSVELQRMAVDTSRIHQKITIGRTFRQRERRLEDYNLNGPGSLSPILERLKSCCREWCWLMRRWRGGDVWGWKEKGRRGVIGKVKRTCLSISVRSGPFNRHELSSHELT
jgi:hypothetical protein